MAKRSLNKTSKRDANAIASKAALIDYSKVNAELSAARLRFEREYRKQVAALEDNRKYHPDPYKALGSVTRKARQIQVAKPRTVTVVSDKYRARFKFDVPAGVEFNIPRQVALCAKRHRRREVLFAKRRTGKGSRARTHKFNQYSTIRC